MKERELFTMKEMDLKFDKTVNFLILVANLRNQVMLFDSHYIYLQHILTILTGNTYKKYIISVLQFGKRPFFHVNSLLKKSFRVIV